MEEKDIKEEYEKLMNQVAKAFKMTREEWDEHLEKVKKIPEVQDMVEKAIKRNKPDET
jgi:uncharacterized phage-like protein YoqJ